MKFSEVHITVPKYIPIDFGDDPDIQPDIRIVTKINKDLFQHRNMYSRKFHAANHYHF